MIYHGKHGGAWQHLHLMTSAKLRKKTRKKGWLRRRTRVINTIFTSRHQNRCCFKPRWCSRLRLECGIPNTCPRDKLIRWAVAPLIGHVPFPYSIMRVSEGAPKLTMTRDRMRTTSTRVRHGVPSQPQISLLYPLPRVRPP